MTKTAQQAYAKGFAKQCREQGADAQELLKQAQLLSGLYNKYVGSNVGKGMSQFGGGVKGFFDKGTAGWQQGYDGAGKTWDTEAKAQKALGSAQISNTGAQLKGIGQDLISLPAAAGAYAGGLVGGGHQEGAKAWNETLGRGTATRNKGYAGIDAAASNYQKMTGKAAPTGMSWGASALAGPAGLILNASDRAGAAIGRAAHESGVTGAAARGAAGAVVGGVPGAVAGSVMSGGVKPQQPQPQPQVTTAGGVKTQPMPGLNYLQKQPQQQKAQPWLPQVAPMSQPIQSKVVLPQDQNQYL
jgi:hypothetical protein